MSVVTALTGIIPPVVMGGAAIKITKGALGKPTARKKGKGRRMKARYPSRNRPF